MPGLSFLYKTTTFLTPCGLWGLLESRQRARPRRLWRTSCGCQTWTRNASPGGREAPNGASGGGAPTLGFSCYRHVGFVFLHGPKKGFPNFAAGTHAQPMGMGVATVSVLAIASQRPSGRLLGGLYRLMVSFPLVNSVVSFRLPCGLYRCSDVSHGVGSAKATHGPRSGAFLSAPGSITWASHATGNPSTTSCTPQANSGKTTDPQPHSDPPLLSAWAIFRRL